MIPGWSASFFTGMTRIGRGRRSWLSPRLRRSNYTGEQLRRIRARKGVGRPPRRAA